MKKNSRKIKRNNIIIILLAIVFLTIIIISGSFLIYIYKQNYIKIEKIDSLAYSQKDEVIKAATPIYINNLLLCGVYKDKWVSYSSMYLKSEKIKEEKIDMYSLEGKIGTYNITNINRAAKENNIYIKTDKLSNQNEYIAVKTSDKNILIGQTTIDIATDNDKKIVKKALGITRLLNNTVKINEVYNVTMVGGENGRIICATSSGKNNFGVYSTIVYSTSKSTKIIKYSYVKNIKKAVDWPIYSLKFVYDLNLDGVSEIVIQETNEYQIKYDLIEYRNNKFYEVMSIVVKI